jgi:hypothetical protein
MTFDGPNEGGTEFTPTAAQGPREYDGSRRKCKHRDGMLAMDCVLCQAWDKALILDRIPPAERGDTGDLLNLIPEPDRIMIIRHWYHRGAISESVLRSAC